MPSLPSSCELFLLFVSLIDACLFCYFKSSRPHPKTWGGRLGPSQAVFNKEPVNIAVPTLKPVTLTKSRGQSPQCKQNVFSEK